MNVTYTPAARQDTAAQSLMHTATVLLEDAIGHSADTTEVSWDCDADNAGRPLYLMTVRNGTETADAVFAREELLSTLHLKGRLYHTWGGLLQNRLERQYREHVGAEG